MGCAALVPAQIAFDITEVAKINTKLTGMAVFILFVGILHLFYRQVGNSSSNFLLLI